MRNRWPVYIPFLFSLCLCRLGLGLESFPSFSGVSYVDGWRVSVVVCGREDHSISIICRRFGIDDFFFVSFFYVGARIFCVLLWVVCGLLVSGNAECVTYNMTVVRRRLGAFTGGVFIGILSLQGGFPWRLWINLLLHAGWCSWIPFVGLLLLGRSLLVMRLASVSSESGVCLGRSTVKQHGVLLMGFKNQDSLLNRESVESF